MIENNENTQSDSASEQSFEPNSQQSKWQVIKSKLSFDGDHSIKHPKSILFVLSILVLIQIIYGLYVSQNPNVFDVKQTAQNSYELTGHTALMPIGYTSTVTLTEIAGTLINKPGGYITNDIFPLSLILDNMPNWEFGVLVQVRDFSSVMRQDFSRSQNNSTEDPNLSLAEPSFNQDSNKWIFPATEKVIKEGIGFTKAYQANLANPELKVAQFYARSDNLVVWLKKVESRLGSYSQRLSSAVDHPNKSAQTDEQDTPKVTSTWTQIDDVFYEARGASWAILHLLKSAQVDFDQVLTDKNAHFILQQIILELESTQQTVWSPIILNGDGFGIVANHSLVLANYISRANAALSQLQKLLENG
ncbi:DUF2333 family protein [Marinicellulosiphila megalodicopiae]|uniref:DUF2333 family protein n=1 Tax=Marinicellulosiphila megalodicopiae TaxID=2724896 RepID=UPI003BAE57DD